MSDSPESIPALLVRLSIAVRTVYGVTTEKVLFRATEKRRSFSLPIPPEVAAGTSAEVVPSAPPKLSRTERRVLEVVGKLNGDAGEPTGPEIAAATRIDYDQNFRAVLSGMRKKGVLGGSSDKPGYPLTVLGYELLHPENGEE